ncbi:FAD-binding domain-containing protein [Zopfia rhizophila CBS 207.26]|uniref:FAD-binding domain-containing protein n=1 Tax=Zopfia rhizophila CBS 207.26 TaxID=1314779 RepID=A0A6A6DF52_9PEZI|nr:FAD-binding domain-containing protein [Zopfia rhizophila CBS 207.26]
MARKFYLALGLLLFIFVADAAIGPAAIVVSADSTTADAPPFDSEAKQLTDEVIQQFANDQSTSAHAKLFTFDDGLPTTARPEVWDTFDALLDGALIPTTPLAAPCYKNWGVYNPAKCAETSKDFTNPYLHEADPTSNMWPIYQGRTCLAIDSPNGTCTLSSFPSYTVNVSNVAQIQLALNFARNANLRLVIKNMGHCYLGKSLGAGSLSVWTHHTKDIRFIENYKSDSGYTGTAMKVGAGVTVREMYQAAHKYNATALGGICESVGYAGGYIAGGGHTPMSGYYDMAADKVETFEVVTADGRLVAASNTSHPDLYWALWGEGGSTFRIVTSVIIQVHPKTPATTSVFTFETSTNITNEIFWEGMRKGNGEDPAKSNKTFEAIKKHSMSGRTIGGYHQAPRNRMNVDNEVSSAFRHVISFLLAASITTPTQIKNATDHLTNNVLGPWSEVSPESDFGGSYLNEANIMETNWQESFYGTNYPKLLEPKKKWDPKSVFYATAAVGSEEWEVRDGDQGTQTPNGRLYRV